MSILLLLPSFRAAATSADTEIPYGDPTLASSAYLPRPDAVAPSAEAADPYAVTETPELTPAQRDILDKIIRVDQAGELGANYIYYGQHAVLKHLTRDRRTTELVQNMWDSEKKHIAACDKLITQHEVRPTALYPLWKAMAFGLGAGTALIGKRAAMACTEAVETVIGKHYNELAVAHARALSLSLLLAHLDTAIENESQQAPAYALLSAVIAGGCRWAIGATSRI
ncbi:hypothetical protein JCM1840_006867 [Sporobolomyces johnsonii]